MAHTFRVIAKVITYCYADIEANYPEEAIDHAAHMNEEDFIPAEKGGEFIIQDNPQIIDKKIK